MPVSMQSWLKRMSNGLIVAIMTAMTAMTSMENETMQ